jgi:aryl-alcohol dehydrogenase-like predicted oxidoreductase
MATEATAAGMISIAGRTVPRMGFGAMQLRGSNGSDAAGAVLRRAVELGVRVIDTAWYYDGDAVNRFIAGALQPYPADLVLATKAGARADYNGSPPKPSPSTAPTSRSSMAARASRPLPARRSPPAYSATPLLPVHGAPTSRRGMDCA